MLIIIILYTDKCFKSYMYKPIESICLVEHCICIVPVNVNRSSLVIKLIVLFCALQVSAIGMMNYSLVSNLLLLFMRYCLKGESIRWPDMIKHAC